MLKSLLIQILSLYQRYISPYKGYSCAYRVQNNALSCSAYAKQVLATHDLGTARQLIQQRLQACALAAEAIKHKPKKTTKRRCLSTKRDDYASVCQMPYDCCLVTGGKVNHCDVTGAEGIGSCV